MARNGPTGQTARAPARRQSPEEQFAPGQVGAAGWPPAQDYPEPQPGPQDYGQQQGQGFYFPQAEGDGGYGIAPQGAQQPAFNGYVPQQASAYGPYAQAQQQAWGPQPDPRGFDLGNYMPAQQGYPPPGVQPHGPASAHDGHFPAPQNEYEADYDDGLGEEEDEPRRGRRGALIVAALVGAIALGGAMAYTYKTFVGGGGGRAPLIRLTDSGPNKIKPENPGGREFAHTDKKLLNRLSEPAAPASEPEAQDDRAGDDPNAPRKVRIIPIAPSAPSAPSAPVVTTASVPARPNSAPVTVSVPGVMLENLGPPAAQTPTQPPPAAVARPPQAPVRVAAAPPPTDLPAAEAPAPRKPAPVKAAVPKVTQPAAATAAASAGSSGFVAVLASKKSRMDALKAFADLQQKYADVLAAKTPDVQEANLGDKGVWYRAVVGPPGSREAASGVCSQLKSAGHSGCWVAAY